MQSTDTNQKNGIVNQAILNIVATLGFIFGIGGMGHGYFEMLQGNTATNGFFIEAIGEANRMWPHGNEPAFTIIPNFLFSGIAAMLVGALIIVWSIRYMDSKQGSLVFLLLFVLLFLVGGGIAQVIFFTIGWAMSTRIHKPLTWWRKVLSIKMRKYLAKLWLPFLIASALLILYTLQVAIFGFVPNTADPDRILMIMLTSLGLGLLLLFLAFISGCAHDIEQ